MRARIAAALVASVVLLSGGVAAPAHAAPHAPTAVKWGWGQLDLTSLQPWRAKAVRDTLIASQPVGLVDARRQALALLVTSGTVTPGQADMLSMITAPSVVDALVLTGHFTVKQGAAVKQLLKGVSATQARYSATKYALEQLTSQGLLTSAEADDIRGQLVGIR